jgi:hypothetical protein
MSAVCPGRADVCGLPQERRRFLEGSSPENIVVRLDEGVRDRRAASRHGNDRARAPEAQLAGLG